MEKDEKQWLNQNERAQANQVANKQDEWKRIQVAGVGKATTLNHVAAGHESLNVPCNT